ALQFAAATLRAGGTLVMKTFGGAEMEATRTVLRAAYASVRLIGLDATRKGSSELYLVARGYRDRAPRGPIGSVSGHRAPPPRRHHAGQRAGQRIGSRDRMCQT
ncbi:MAG: SAM-dependent methyltransferase, partial [Candidatus Binatia bacterium]